MTPDERNMLNDLAAKVAGMPAPARDPEAEDIIRTKIGNRPDALYLMTQTVLIQNLALQRAQQQIQDMQSRGQGADQSAGSGASWLGQGSGSVARPPQQAQYAAPPPPQQQYYAPSGPAPSFGGGGGGGFLRGAAQTAAGVAAGTLAAEAIGSMFSHGGGFGGDRGFVGGGMAPTEEVVNNYYDSPGGDSGRGNDNFADVNAAADNSGQYDDRNQLDDNTQFDDNSQFDDSSLDDGGGFDGGSDDSLV